MAIEHTDYERLPCGSDIDTVLAHERDGEPTEHELRCPHCRAAVEEHGVLLAARSELAAERVVAPPHLLDDVMRLVRADPRSRRALRVPGEEEGVTRVRRSAAAAVLRTAAEDVPGVADARVAELIEGEDGIEIELRVRLHVGTPVPRVDAALRTRVAEVVRDQLGWRTARLDISVLDVEDGR
ncbi:hypothetical protein CDO52_25940 [Nocardiopsis gilva YIM 90087]|uniref:Asp23/Gls24 family protein n=1 Tax=Nocardiopsis gilva YIM 90087 TaxID=1235441 RepID=A0A223SC94_9ACTN|nr:hypothetical protein [Nocardiopsis gilva]ASU85784.1 hypothetical protein CDO52_25940 [Nocardiopsis gilva YIM 90087]